MNAHLMANTYVKCCLAQAAQIAVEHRRHELYRIMHLQPACLVSDYSISGGVAFVEGVAGEGHDILKNLFGNIEPDPAGDGSSHRISFFVLTAMEKQVLVFGQFCRLLLRHGAADVVRLPHGKSGQVADYLHDLFLIDDAAVGHVEDRFEQRVVIPDLFRIVLGRDIAGDLLHRSRPVQRNAGNDILKRFGLEFLHETGHA